MLQPGARVLLVQVAVGLIVASCAVSSGMSLGFSAVVDQPLLESPDNLTDDQVSWFVSLASVATPLGCLTVGPLLDAVGRRPTLLVLNAPFLLGWVLLATSPSGGTAQMYAGRLFTGFATGMASVPATVYLGEMSQARLRGMFVTWTSVAISVGILVVYLLGTGFREDWRYAAWACAALPVISAPLVALVVPESPPWLNQKGRAEAAEASLRRLRAVGGRAPLPPALAEELAGLPPPRAPPPDGERRSALALLRATGAELARPAAWKPLLIMNVFFLFQQITGIYVVVGYAVRIATEAQVTIDTYVMSVLMGAVQVVAGAGVSFALRFWRRRPLSVWSGIVQVMVWVINGLAVRPLPRPDSAFQRFGCPTAVFLTAVGGGGAARRDSREGCSAAAATSGCRIWTWHDSDSQATSDNDHRSPTNLQRDGHPLAGRSGNALA